MNTNTPKTKHITIGRALIVTAIVITVIVFLIFASVFAWVFVRRELGKDARISPDPQAIGTSGQRLHEKSPGVSDPAPDHSRTRDELKFRGELGYPPFRRLAIVTVTAKAPTDLRRLTDDVAAALASERELTVYPPAADRRDRLRRIVVKGRDNLAVRLAAVLAELRKPRPKSRGVVEVEVDPVEWQW